MDDEKLFPGANPRSEFLGSFMGHDLYWDAQNGVRPTVIARFGVEFEAYKSGLMLADHDEHLAEARRRAMARGFDITVHDYMANSPVTGIPGQFRLGVSIDADGGECLSLMMAPAQRDAASVIWVGIQLRAPSDVLELMAEIYRVSSAVFGPGALSNLVQKQASGE